ncbi:hypothetical protein [Pseudomonas salomonii]|uniref:Uncharacterized protein n=1 Tax=Pseudomonas salomonii TaxID=191391 RepID=A0A1H3IKY9_9PSED|nr:hypothetical protein [Pseudomonas salomonii]SDY28351.1 hypothetical protein SAMN05216247_103292 [Pseudomonas salomonii]
MIRRIGAFAILGVLSRGSRYFAGTAPAIPTNAIVYELSAGQYEAEKTDDDEVIVYENNQ